MVVLVVEGVVLVTSEASDERSESPTGVRYSMYGKDEMSTNTTLTFAALETSHR